VRVDGDVDGAPPDLGFGVGVLDDALVFGRAAGFDPGVGGQRAVVDDAGVFFVTDGVLVEGA
jgi:hypothetical protein